MNSVLWSAYPTCIVPLLICAVYLGAATRITIGEKLASIARLEKNFRCAGSDVRVPAAMICDGNADCDNGSDEDNCVQTTASSRDCSAIEFQCANGQCVWKWERCNGKYDCDDLSDETHPSCNGRTCLPDQFQCKNYPRTCIRSSWRCDGVRDCADGSDEEDCSRNCSALEFQCTSGQCVWNWKRCDGKYDCDDLSDETHPSCNGRTCLPNQFQCKNYPRACIRSAWKCDGFQDCADGSDEDDCPP